MKIKCPKCKRTNTYLTTDKYNPDIAPNGSMVRLRNPNYKGGLTFGTAKGGSNSAIKAQFMECCDCGGMLTFGGKLIVIPEEPVENNLGDFIIADNVEIYLRALKDDDIIKVEEPKKRVKK